MQKEATKTKKEVTIPEFVAFRFNLLLLKSKESAHQYH